MQNHDYFRSGESEQFAYFRMPKILFRDPEYSRISTDSKLLYGLMLDRMELSRKNGWIDEKDRVYIIFTVAEMMELLNRSESFIQKLLNELDTKDAGAGLIERRHQGQGRPNIIYVKKFYDGYYRFPEHAVSTDKIQSQGKYDRAYEEVRAGPLHKTGPDPFNKEVKTFSENRSGPLQKRGQDLFKKQPNNTDTNKTEKKKTEGVINSSSSALCRHGSFHNVVLSEHELEELKRRFPSDWEYWIERLSGYMASSGRSYQNHFATICLWAGEKPAHKTVRDYTYPKGASL